MNDDARRVSETLGTGQEVFAHWGGRVKDVHANCRDKIERLQQVADDLANHEQEVESLQKQRDHYWATTNDAISERNRWVRLFKLAFDSHFDKTWDGETADLLGQAYDEAECICGDDKL